MSNVIHVKDRLCQKDSIVSKPMWARTEVLVSNGDVIFNPTGKNTFAPGSPFTRSSNMVVIGGTQYAMENLFGIKSEQITIPTMYEKEGIGLPNSTPPTETYRTPDGTNTIIYRPGNIIQLMGVGITGTAENDVSVYPVSYRENSVSISVVNPDGLTVNGTLLPFRCTAEQLNDRERKQYFGKKVFTDEYHAGKTGYYLKKFESDPVIKHVWKTGEDIDDETIISPSDVWDNTVGLNAVESFTEIILQVSRKDLKEYFIDLEQEDRARFNTIALFSGEYVKDEEDAADYGDYRDVRLFSKLCIPTEYVTLAKDVNIIWRCYTM